MAAKRAATPATTGMLLDFAADEEVELAYRDAYKHMSVTQPVTALSSSNRRNLETHAAGVEPVAEGTDIVRVTPTASQVC